MKRSASQDAQAQPGGAIGDRFGQIFAQRLAAVGLDAREWLMLPPSAEALESTDPAVFVSIDPRRDPARWERLYAPGRHAPAPDFMGQALPFAQERFAAVLIGGLGSHLLPGRHFHEFMLAYNTDPPWIFSLDYGSTFSPNAPCAERAAAALRAILDRPECRGKQALLICHSKGAALAHILLAEARFADLHPRIWGVAAFAGAIGGSPHAESALAHAARATRDKTPDWIAHGLAAALRALGVAIPHSLIRAAPTLGELPDALPDLARDARQAYLRSHPLPEDKWFFSVAGAIEPDRLRAAEPFKGELDAAFLAWPSKRLAPFGALNDAMVLLRDAHWPEGPRVRRLAAIRAHHFGIAYRNVVPGAKREPTPRLAMFEALLSAIAEAFGER